MLGLLAAARGVAIPRLAVLEPPIDTDSDSEPGEDDPWRAEVAALLAQGRDSILVGSEHPERLVEFYTGLFGEPTWSDGGYTGWQLGSGGLMIGPHDQVRGKNAHPGRLIWNLETDDVRGTFEQFRDAGATVVAEPYGPEGEETGLIATFADPDDNYFQLMSPMPAS